MPRLLSLLFTTVKLASKYPQKSCAFQLLPSTSSLSQFPKNPNPARSFTSNYHHPPLYYIRGGSSTSSLSGETNSERPSIISSTSLASSSSSSSSINGEGSESSSSSRSTSPRQTSKREGQTGWNHNLPKDTSTFWTEKSEKDRFDSENQQEVQEPKTGWLHTKKKKIPSSSSSSSGTKGSSGSEGKESTARKLLKMAKLKQKVNHRMISPPTFHPVGEGRRVAVTEHYISVPLNHKEIKDTNDLLEKDNVECIDVYFSIVDLISTPAEEEFFQTLLRQVDVTGVKTSSQRLHEQQKRASDYTDFIAMKDADKCILYLQGGPGFGAPQPINGIGLGDKSSWAGAALGKGYKRIVLMDQRGTGRSSTITKQTLEKKFPDLFIFDDISPKVVADGDISSIESVKKELEEFENTESEKVAKFHSSLSEATTYMTRFRADSIVRDAERIKEALMIPLNDNSEATPRPWGAALGQSFGGFCMMSYLSLIPNPPKICLLTGGIAPMLTNVDDVYCSLRDRVKKRNMKYYDTYPGDILLVKRIVKRLLEKPAPLPSGGILTARRFLQVGIGLGGSPSAFASLHSLFSSAFISDEDDDLSRAFLKNIDILQPFDDHPIYCLLHESIYADSNSDCAKSDWSAMKAYSPERDFDCTIDKESEPTLLFGEVVFPWMVDGDYAELSGLSMRALAHSLSSKDDWEDLYDAAAMRNALATVSKAAAAVYYDDMYVDFNASMKVTERGNPLEKCAVWVTNDYQHSGLRDDGAAIFSKLLGMAKGEVGTPS